MAITKKKMEINSIIADDTVFRVDPDTHNDTSSDKFNLCLVACQIKITTYKYATVLASRNSAGLMEIGTQGNIVERRCFITARDTIYILP